MGKVLLVTILLLALGGAAPARAITLTQIMDTLKNPDGTNAAVRVDWCR